MEDVLPTYQSATARDAWTIIAQYIPSSDLCAASLVCRRWHELFMPFLWGDPASHFGTENDAVYGKGGGEKRNPKSTHFSHRVLFLLTVSMTKLLLHGSGEP